MQILLKLAPDVKQSLQQQVFESIRQQILTGRLNPGMLLPSSRLLSEQLGVSRNTIIYAYERLVAEGYLYSQRSVGTFVNPNLPDDSLMITDNTKSSNGIQQEEVHTKRHPVAFDGRVQALFNPYHDQLNIDFWVGRPDPHSFPNRTWRQLLLKNLEHSGSNMTEYHDPGGVLGLRKAIADHLRAARGIDTMPEQIIIVNGIQQALNLVARVLIKPGNVTTMECPCYQGAAFVMESYGAKLHPVPVDSQGLDTTLLPTKSVSLAYVTPSHQYPLGVTLSPERRIQLLNWAKQTGAYILEDDYDSDFRHQGSPLTAVAGQDQYGCVIYMGTFSKSIGAALRLGYVVAPQELVDPVRKAKALMDNGHAWLDQVVLRDFIVTGAYLKHLRRIRRTYLNRRDGLTTALQRYFGNVQLSGLEGGMHLVWHLPKSFPKSETVQKMAQDAGIGVYSLPAAAVYDFGNKAHHDRTLLLGYSSVTEKQISDGIATLATTLKS